MKRILLFTSLLCVLISADALAINGDMGIGTDPNTNGSEAYPYLIEDFNDLVVFAVHSNYWVPGLHTKLMTDIDLAGRTYTTAVIARYPTSFTGIFDGNGHTVSNLTINAAGVSNNYLGLFGKIEYSSTEVKNLVVVDCNIIGGSYLGGLCGYNRDATITNCHSTGSVSGTNDYIGGLLGFNNGGIIADCYFNGSVTGDRTVGGLVGANDNGIIADCYSTGSVSDIGFRGGGLVGNNFEGTIENCYSAANVSGYTSVGGLIGENTGNIANCYSTGAVSGYGSIGGLVGYAARYGIIENCYSSCLVSGDHFVGGLVGEAWGSYSIIKNCYSNGLVTGNAVVGGFVGFYDHGCYITGNFWDMETSGITNGIGVGDSSTGGVDGKTTSEMMTQSTFTGWDFDPDDGDPADWMMLREDEDYPRLAWQEVFDGDIAGLYGVNMADFARLASQWGEVSCNESDNWCQGADIDHADGVDIKDLASVAEDWMK